MKQIIDMAVDGEVIPAKVAIVSPRKYYGVRPKGKSCLHKGFITRARIAGGGFLVISCEGMTNGDSWDFIGKSCTLAGCINKLMANHFFVFEFDTPAELGRWMAGEVACGLTPD